MTCVTLEDKRYPSALIGVSSIDNNKIFLLPELGASGDIKLVDTLYSAHYVIRGLQKL